MEVPNKSNHNSKKCFTCASIVPKVDIHTNINTANQTLKLLKWLKNCQQLVINVLFTLESYFWFLFL